MKRGVCKVLVALGAHLAVWGWSVDEADAQVLRWRTNGTECRHQVHSTTGNFAYQGGGTYAGMEFIDTTPGNSANSPPTCFIPTGRDLLELHTTNGRRLRHVNMRLEQFGAVTETTGVRLVTTNFIAGTYCVCDYKQRTGGAGTFFVSVLYSSCAANPACGTDWGVSLDMFMTDDNFVAYKSLKVRLLSAYSD